MRAYTALTLAALALMGTSHAGFARSTHHARTPLHVHHVTTPAPVTGLASWYGVGDGSSNRTASGRAFNPQELGVAHASWPFGTKLKMTSVDTGRTAVVTVLDRTGPAVSAKGRTFDLYYGAAVALGITGKGQALVRAEPVGEVEVAEAPPEPPSAPVRHHRGRARRR